MKHIQFFSMLIVSIAIAGCGSNSSHDSQAQSNSYENGKTLFKSKICVTCHNIGNGDMPTGPDLKGVTDRRKKVWIRRWMKKTSAMYETDATAKKLIEKFNGILMPDPYPPLTNQEIEDLISFIEEDSKK